MNDVASAVCDINIQVNKLNRIIRTGYNTDIQEINNTADAIETFLKDIRELLSLPKNWTTSFLCLRVDQTQQRTSKACARLATQRKQQPTLA